MLRGDSGSTRICDVGEHMGVTVSPVTRPVTVTVCRARIEHSEGQRQRLRTASFLKPSLSPLTALTCGK